MQLFNRSSKVRATKSGKAGPPAIQFLLTQTRAGARRNGAGSVIAFTSANSGAGVSHVVRHLGSQLAAQTREPTAIVEAERLASLRPTDLVDLRAKCARTNIDQLWMLRESGANGHQTSDELGSYILKMADGSDCVQKLRATFRHTLLDCPPISDSSEAPFLASQVDGIVLVVEADLTKRDQILRAQYVIEMGGGKLLGMVLNKRRHLVPEWLYKRL
jgi:Mrp family chromosome partitioning ATPase